MSVAMTAPAAVKPERCGCGHRKLAHELDDVAPHCAGEHCCCQRYQPAETQAPRDFAATAPTSAREEPGAAVNPEPTLLGKIEQQINTMPPRFETNPGPPTPEPTPQTLLAAVDQPGPVDALIRVGKASPIESTVALAEELNQLADDLRRRLAEEAEQQQVLAEIAELEEKLTAARARLRKDTEPPRRPAKRRIAVAGDHACPDCGETFTTAQGLGRHRAWSHGYKSPSHHPSSGAVDCPDCGKALTAAGLALHRVRAHGYRRAAAS